MYSIILFDGVCNFCNGAVNFLLRQDRAGKFRFAALQSPAGREVARRYGLPEGDLSTFILIEDGTVYRRSTAALRVAAGLPPYWRWLLLFYIFPRPLRDGMYNAVARYRYRLFGRREECRLPEPRWRERFL